MRTSLESLVRITTKIAVGSVLFAPTFTISKHGYFFYLFFFLSYLNTGCYFLILSILIIFTYILDVGSFLRVGLGIQIESDNIEASSPSKD
jgi:uncharacterized BrkB/YihY/UPF0761 family membrane protein